MVRQFGRHRAGLGRSLYAELNWRKLRHDEVAWFRRADGLCACSAADCDRILEEVPAARTAIIPNAADVDFFAPRPSDPPGDGRTIVFFGLMSTFPNIDGAGWLLREIWPRIASVHPDARCKIIGKGAPKEIRTSPVHRSRSSASSKTSGLTWHRRPLSWYLSASAEELVSRSSKGWPWVKRSYPLPSARRAWR